MNSQNETCGIIEDLIPLYAENLCSEESRAAVEAHLQHCERCRKLADALPAAPPVPAEAVPDEAKTFRKVNRFMTKNRRLNLVLILLLALILLGLGLLTVGQITKAPELQSFETLWQSADVRPMVHKLTSGDYSGFVSDLSIGVTQPVAVNSYLQTTRDQDAELLRSAYEAAFGSTSVKRISSRSYYTESVINHAYVVGTNVTIFYQDGRELELFLNRGADQLYECAPVMYSADDGSDTTAMEKLESTMNFICSHELKSGWILQAVMQNAEPFTDSKDDLERLDRRCDIIANRFDPACKARIREQFLAFYQNGYLIKKCSLSEVEFDHDTKSLFYSIYITAADDQGTALLTARIPFTVNGLCPQDPAQNKVYPDGCSEALADDLRNLF